MITAQSVAKQQIVKRTSFSRLILEFFLVFFWRELFNYHLLSKKYYHFLSTVIYFLVPSYSLNSYIFYYYLLMLFGLFNFGDFFFVRCCCRN